MAAASNNDGRRALGIRPGATPIPTLRINDEESSPSPISTSLRLPSDNGPSPRHKVIAAFQDLSLTIPEDADGQDDNRDEVYDPLPPSLPTSPSLARFRRATLGRSPTQPTPSPGRRGVYETQKLLAHLLDRLDARRRPPDLLDRAAEKARRGVSSRVSKSRRRLVVNIGNSRDKETTGSRGIGSDDKHGDEDDIWNTEGAFELLQQLRDLLVLSTRQKMDIFGVDTTESSKKMSDVKRKRGGRLSSFTSPISQPESGHEVGDMASSNKISGLHLQTRLLDLIRDLILTDSAFRVTRFRLSAPPLALQATCLDIATVLYSLGDLDAQIACMQNVTDGLYTMVGMSERICAWLEARLPELLALHTETGGTTTTQNFINPFTLTPGSPLVPATTRNQASLSSGWKRFSPISPSTPSDIRLADLVHVQAIAQRTLNAVISCIDLSTVGLSTIARYHRLIACILTARVDSPGDLLGIIANGSGPARRSAASLLATFFPLAVGHNAISRRLPSATYAAQRLRWETGQDRVLGEDVTGQHHYVPWRISSKDGSARSRVRCRLCGDNIHGFAVRCSLCNDVEHLSCCSASTFRYDSNASGSTTITIRYSEQSLTLDERLKEGLTGPRSDTTGNHRKCGDHDLRSVDLLQVGLCTACHLPMWSLEETVYACQHCQRLVHGGCVSRLSTECRHNTILVTTIDETNLKAHFDRCIKPLVLSDNDIERLSFDELSVIYGILWTQYHLYKNGTTAGSIVSSGDQVSDPFRMRSTLRQYEEDLANKSRDASHCASGFASVIDSESPIGPGYLFADRYLRHVLSLCYAHSGHLGDDEQHDISFLTVGSLAPEQIGYHTPEQSVTAISRTQLLDTLGRHAGVRDSLAGDHLVNHLQRIGFIRILGQARYDGETEHFFAIDLPGAPDFSHGQQDLLSAIEALLSDVDLAQNELGLRLLFDRTFPSALHQASDLERTAMTLVLWALDSERVASEVTIDYARRHRRLPGLRLGGSNRDALQSASGIEAYEQARQHLFMLYGFPWLSALHDIDAELYCHVVHDACLPASSHKGNFTEDQEDDRLEMASGSLYRLAAALAMGIAFGHEMDLVALWLDDLGDLADEDDHYQDLQKLSGIKASPQQENSASVIENVVTLVHELVTEDSGHLERVSRWLRVLACSDVSVPYELFEYLVDRVVMCTEDQTGSVVVKTDLVVAIQHALKASDPVSCVGLLARLLVCYTDEVKAMLVPALPTAYEIDFLRACMLAVFRFYGVQLDQLSRTAFRSDDGERSTGVARNKRYSPHKAYRTFPLNESVVLAIATLISQGHYPTELLVDALWLLFDRAPLASNAHGTLFSMSETLTGILWPLMDARIDRRCRARLLLRVVSVNARPLETLLRSHIIDDASRIHTVERLLRVILELADETVLVDSSQWRPAAVGVLGVFFDTVLDSVRLDSHSMVVLETLLPSHLAAVSICFEEKLAVSSEEERLELLSRMHRYASALPHWQIVSWRVLDDLITESVIAVTQLAPGKSTKHISALSDSQLVRCHLLALGLHMLAAGVHIPWQAAMRLQQHIAAACAIPWSHPQQGVASLVLPALRTLLDSGATITPPSQASAFMSSNLTPGTTEPKAKQPVLVGSLVVPVVIDFTAMLGEGAFLAQRAVLDIVLVTLYKHKLDTVELQALRAIQLLAEFVERSDCTDSRILALSAIHVALDRMTAQSVVRIVGGVFIPLARVLATSSEEKDSIVLQPCHAVLLRLIDEYGRAGLVSAILRLDGAIHQPTSTAGNSVLSEAISRLGTAPVGSATPKGSSATTLMFTELSDTLKRGRQALEFSLNALCRFSKGVSSPLTPEAIDGFGVFLNKLAKHVTDWHVSEFDPDPILGTCAQVMALAPRANLEAFLSQTATFLHLSLTRFVCDTKITASLLVASADAAHRASTEDALRTVMYEVAQSSVHGVVVAPQTMCSLLDFLISPTTATQSTSSTNTLRTRGLVDAASGAMSILLRHNASAQVALAQKDAHSLHDMQGKSAALVLHAEECAPGSLATTLATVTGEAVEPLVRMYTYLVTEALTSDALHGSREAILTLGFPLMARTAALAFRATADALLVPLPMAGDASEGTQGAHQLLQAAVRLVKTATLLAHRTRRDESTSMGSVELGQVQVDVLQRRVWPEWERMIGLSVEKTCLNSALGHAVQHEFIEMIAFLSSLDSPLLIRHAGRFTDNLQLIKDYTRAKTRDRSSADAYATLGSIDESEGIYSPDARGEDTVRNDLKFALEKAQSVVRHAGMGVDGGESRSKIGGWVRDLKEELPSAERARMESAR